MIKRLLSFLLLLAAVGVAQAYDFKEGYLCYNFNDDGTSVTVTYEFDNSYPRYTSFSGHLDIPPTVTHDGTTYAVTAIGKLAFQGCVSMTSVTIPNSVTTIGDKAFQYNNYLTSAPIPASVTSIGICMFTGCTNLERVEIDEGNPIYDARDNCNGIIETATNTLIFGSSRTTIPNSVTAIGYYAFYSCNDLMEVNIPESVTTIGSCAFEYCTGLSSVTIPNSVTTIEAGAFNGCTGLFYVSIGKSVETIGNGAFTGCTGLTNVTLPKSVTTIGMSAFRECTGLQSIVIPESVTEIGLFAFMGCTELADFYCHITDPTNVTLGNNVFRNVPSTMRLHVPKDTGELYGNAAQWNAFDIVEDLDNPNSRFKVGELYYTINDDKTTATVTYENPEEESEDVPAYNELAGDIVIPDHITHEGVTYTVTAISENAFRDCTGITGVTIPNTVTAIGEFAFNDCENLVSAKLPEAIEMIESYTFEGCESLASIVIPDAVLCIGHSAFDDCHSLASVTIGKSVTKIEEFAFADCKSLTSVIIPESVTCIDHEAFEYCRGLKTLTIGSSVDVIGENAFEQCIALTDVYSYPSSDDIELGRHIFYEVTTANVTLHVLPQYLDLYRAADQWKEFGTILGDLEGEEPQSDFIEFADANVEALCVAKWDTDCDGRLSYAEAAAVTDLGTVFKNNTTITSFDELQYFTGLTAIGEEAFDSCTGLTSVTIGNSVTSIGFAAFYKCTGLTSIVIPESVISIGGEAFERCANLTSVTIGNSVTSIGNWAFYKCSGLTSIVIPESVTTIYELAFAYCTGLTSVTIGNSVSSIGKLAFKECTSLTSIVIPTSVTSLGTNPFFGCSALTSIFVESDNTVYDSREGCNAIIETATNILIGGCQNTVIPSTVTAIGGDAFNGCSGLASVVIPESVTSIGEGAFQDCTGLTRVTIGNSVTTIYGFAFAGCTGLTDMYAYVADPTTISLGNNVFYGVPTTMTVHVPKGSGDLYRAAAQWNSFNIVEMDDEGPVVTAEYDVAAAPTSVVITAELTVAEGDVARESYFELEGERYDRQLKAIGLLPDHDYVATHTVVTATGETVVTDVPFHTAELVMTALPADMLTNTDAMIKASTNIADEEIGTGFQWQRNGAPATMPPYTVSCPTFGGMMAGTLHGLTEERYYDFRPYYQAADGTMFVGEWMTLFTADAGVTFEPTTYTYHSPQVGTNDATLEGVALRGTDEIDEQGFELWSADNASARRHAPASPMRFQAEGERMKVDISGLDYATAYAFRTYVIAGGETTYGDIVTFVTDRPVTDVNIDGKVDVGDVNTVLADILMSAGDLRLDVNHDNAVDVGDVNTILTEILNYKKMRKRYPSPAVK